MQAATLSRPAVPIKTLAQRSGLSLGDISDLTGLSVGAIHNAIYGGNHRINDVTADAIAYLFDRQVAEVIWPRPTTNTGRPPYTGVCVSTAVATKEELCPACNAVLASNGACSICG